VPHAETAKAVQLLDLTLEFLPMTATGRAAVTTTETAMPAGLPDQAKL
jgi:hypothetical protein